jgi:hypothetical protein
LLPTFPQQLCSDNSTNAKQIIRGTVHSASETPFLTQQPQHPRPSSFPSVLGLLPHSAGNLSGEVKVKGEGKKRGAIACHIEDGKWGLYICRKNIAMWLIGQTEAITAGTEEVQEGTCRWDAMVWRVRRFVARVAAKVLNP